MLQVYATHHCLPLTLSRSGCYESLEQYAKATPLYEESLNLRVKAFGIDHPAVAQSMNNLAGMRFRQGKHDEAIGLYERSRDIKIKLYGSESIDVAESLNNIAVLHMAGGKLASAVHYQEQAVSMLQKILGPDHPNTVNVRGNLGISYKRMGFQDLGDKMVNEALAFLAKNSYPVSHPWVKKFTAEMRRDATERRADAPHPSDVSSVSSRSPSSSSSDPESRRGVSTDDSSGKYVTPGRVKRAPVRIAAASPATPGHGRGRKDSDGDFVDIDEVQLRGGSDSDEDAVALDEIVMDDFLIDDNGNPIDVEKGKGASKHAANKKKSRRTTKPSEARGSSSRNDKRTAEERLAALASQSTSRQISVNIVDKTVKKRRGSHGSDASRDSSTRRKDPTGYKPRTQYSYRSDADKDDGSVSSGGSGRRSVEAADRIAAVEVSGMNQV
jgi:hypothetical protein